MHDGVASSAARSVTCKPIIGPKPLYQGGIVLIEKFCATPSSWHDGLSQQQTCSTHFHHIFFLSSTCTAFRTTSALCCEAYKNIWTGLGASGMLQRWGETCVAPCRCSPGPPGGTGWTESELAVCLYEGRRSNPPWIAPARLDHTYSSWISGDPDKSI